MRPADTVRLLLFGSKRHPPMLAARTELPHDDHAAGVATVIMLEGKEGDEGL